MASKENLLIGGIGIIAAIFVFNEVRLYRARYRDALVGAANG